MKSLILIVIGSASALTGVVIFLLPRLFYDTVPGLDLMGPFNMHFVRDVGLVYLANGAALAWAARTRNRPVALAATAWFVLHALFHIQIWGHRGFPFDGMFAFDLVMVIGLAALAGWAAWGLEREPR